jgi:hypothetical protein
MGLLRNLSAGEILAQVAAARRAAVARGMPDVSNVVFMGMVRPPPGKMRSKHQNRWYAMLWPNRWAKHLPGQSFLP